MMAIVDRSRRPATEGRAVCHSARESLAQLCVRVLGDRLGGLVGMTQHGHVVATARRDLAARGALAVAVSRAAAGGLAGEPAILESKGRPQTVFDSLWRQRGRTLRQGVPSLSLSSSGSTQQSHRRTRREVELHPTEREQLEQYPRVFPPHAERRLGSSPFRPGTGIGPIDHERAEERPGEQPLRQSEPEPGDGEGRWDRRMDEGPEP